MIIQPPKIRYNIDNKVFIDTKLFSKARSLYNQVLTSMSLGGLSSLQRRYNILGYSITITTYNNGISGFNYGYIDIDNLVIKGSTGLSSIYLENGFISAPITFDDSGNFLKIPVLKLLGSENLNGRVAFYDGDWFTTKGVTNNQLTKTITCKSSKRDESKNYCNFGSIYAKIRDRTYIQPCNFSGKMKLFVQSLYGSKREDYGAVFNGIQFDSKKLIFQGLIIDPIYSYDNWLIHTHRDEVANTYRYFLVKVGLSSFEYIPLNLSTVGESWASLLYISNKEVKSSKKDKIEAYILSTASLDLKTNNSINRIVIPLGFSIPGEAVHYGWQANWEGSELSVILHTYINMNGSSLDPVDTPGSEWAYDPKIYTAKISSVQIKNDIQLKATVAYKSAGDPWQVKNGISLIWRPDYLLGGHSVMDFAGTFSTRYVGGFKDSAVVCWYDKQDTLKTISYTDDRKTVPSGSDVQTQTLMSERQYLGSGKALSQKDLYWNAGDIGGIYMYVGDLEFHHDGENAYGEYTYYRKFYAENVPGSGTIVSTTSNTSSSPDAYRPDFFLEARTTPAYVWAGATQWFTQSSYYSIGKFVEPIDYNDQYQIRTIIGDYNITGFAYNYKNVVPRFFLSIPYNSCDTYVVGDMLDRQFLGIVEKVVPSGRSSRSYWEIVNPRNGAVLATSQGVSCSRTAHDCTDDLLANQTNRPDVNESTVDEYAIIDGNKIKLYSWEGVVGYPSLWFYVNWIIGPYNQGGGPYIQTNLNSSYNINYNSTLNFNSSFLGSYAVGYS